MYIRQTRTANKSTGEAYLTFRLVRGERIGGRVPRIWVSVWARHHCPAGHRHHVRHARDGRAPVPSAQDASPGRLRISQAVA